MTQYLSDQRWRAKIFHKRFFKNSVLMLVCCRQLASIASKGLKTCKYDQKSSQNPYLDMLFQLAKVRGIFYKSYLAIYLKNPVNFSLPTKYVKINSTQQTYSNSVTTIIIIGMHVHVYKHCILIDNSDHLPHHLALRRQTVWRCNFPSG